MPLRQLKSGNGNHPEELIERGKLTADLLASWRSYFQEFPWFVMGFAGRNTLHEMRQDYWEPFFASVQGVPVSFLKAGAARQLITNPSPDFDIDYDEDALEYIYELTHGQPYLLNLIGHSLVTRFNEEVYETGKERERRFRRADVEEVINTPYFYEEGSAYFTGVWGQAEVRGPAGRTAILRVLAPHVSGLTLHEIIAATGLGEAEVREALATLKKHDVIMSPDHPDSPYRFTVELMRQWVAQREGKSLSPDSQDSSR